MFPPFCCSLVPFAPGFNFPWLNLLFFFLFGLSIKYDTENPPLTHAQTCTLTHTHLPIPPPPPPPNSFPIFPQICIDTSFPKYNIYRPVFSLVNQLSAMYTLVSHCYQERAQNIKNGLVEISGFWFDLKTLISIFVRDWMPI